MQLCSSIFFKSYCIYITTITVMRLTVLQRSSLGMCAIRCPGTYTHRNNIFKILFQYCANLCGFDSNPLVLCDTATAYLPSHHTLSRVSLLIRAPSESQPHTGEIVLNRYACRTRILHTRAFERASVWSAIRRSLRRFHAQPLKPPVSNDSTRG